MKTTDNIKTTQYFDSTRARSERAGIEVEWIVHVMNHPVKRLVQKDG